MRSRRLLESIQADLRRLRKEVELAGLAGSDRSAGSDLGLSPARYELELAELQTQLDAIRESESYRLGHAVVRAVRSPVRTLRGLAARPGREPRASRRRPSKSRPRRRGGKNVFLLPAAEAAVGPLSEPTQTTMVVIWGLPPEQVQGVVDDVCKLQLMLRDFKPLFVTDSEDWALFQKHGYWFEHLLSASEWERHRDRGEWAAYVAERMTAIVATYAPGSVVVYEGGGNELLRSGALNSIVGKRLAPAEEGPRPNLRRATG